MKRSDFEKRHGKINFQKSGHWVQSTATKYGIYLDKDVDLPAHIWHVMQNMKNGASLESIQNIFKYLSGEPRKEVRDLFLMNLDSLYFSSYWGFFSGEKLQHYKNHGGVKMLRCLRNGFKKYKYKPIYGTNINKMIVELGGNVNTKKPLEDATKKLQNASKLPRRMKKAQKTQFSFWVRALKRTK